MKICFITSLISDNYLKVDSPGHFNKLEYCDYYLFTNLNKDNFNTSWTLVNISDEYLNNVCNTEFNQNYIYKSRYIKFMGWDYIKNQMKLDYDIIFYCDSVYSPNNKIDWNKISKKIIKNKSGLIQRHHPVQTNVYEECKNCIIAKKDSYTNMHQMEIFLKNHNTPETIIIKENTSFGYNPKNNIITNAFKDFWKYYTLFKYTYRDQPLWTYVYWKHNLEAIMDENIHSMFKNRVDLYFLYTGTYNNNRNYLA